VAPFVIRRLDGMREGMLVMVDCFEGPTVRRTRQILRQFITRKGSKTGSGKLGIGGSFSMRLNTGCPPWFRSSD
jgi:hypothetical protein